MADLRINNHRFGFSIKSLMAICFTITACYLAIAKIMGIEAFMALASTVVYAYFRKQEEPPNANPPVAP